MDLTGKLLLSSGKLFDPNFRHTVTLIVQHDEEGAMGLVLNRPTEDRVEEAVPALASIVEEHALLHHGGPVQPQMPLLLAELTMPSVADVLVFGAVGLLTGDVDSDISSAIVRSRVFAGYAGWSAGQLEAEMEEDSWIVESATADDVFTSDPKTLWQRILERNPKYRNLARIPFDPTLN